MWRRGFQRGIGVRFVLLAVVAVPLASFLILAAGVVTGANREVTSTQRAKAAGEELASATTLQAAVAVEYYWAGATTTVVNLGLDPAELAGSMGVDVAEEWVRTQALVDQLVAQGAPPGLRSLLDDARAQRDVVSGGAYDQADDMAQGRVDEATARLEDAALAVDDPAAMVRATAALTGTVELRSEVFRLVAGYFSARFPDYSLLEDPLDRLATARVRYDTAVEDLAVDADPAFAETLAALIVDVRTQKFLNAVDAVRLGAPALGDAASDSAMMDQAITFGDSLAMLDEVGALVDIASSDLDLTGEQLTASAERTRLQVVLAVFVVGSATIAIVVLIGRWVVRSLDGISTTAGAMNGGELDVPAPVRGPTEVRVAAQALNGAADNIRSAERQILALASGDLTESDGPAHVAGRLGDSLYAAFDRLAESMKDREDLRRELHQEANHDGLTGLPNRSAIMKGLASAVAEVARDGDQVAVLFVDIDGFKFINDHHGHAVGDQVLVGIAERVRRAARSGDLVGRLGGDELVVIAHPVDGMDEALSLARRIRKVVGRPLPTAAAITPSISIGVATGSGSATTPERLLHDADLAVYQAKAAGGNVIEVCTSDLRQASAHRQAVEQALSTALAADDLEIALQAVIAAESGLVVGAEALVRWPQGDGSVKAPGEFVTIAERSNLIVDLDRWVIDQTVDVLARWKDDPATASLTASVNLSARHASFVPFADHILAVLARRGVASERLVVELTESALIANLDHVVEELRALRAGGVVVAIDDFGTGYTSLALLHQLPVDTLKLDRVLTSSLGDERILAVVQLVVNTAHLIGLSVVAEGLETEAQVEQVRQLGVDALQGFHLHRPCSVEAFADELVDGHGSGSAAAGALPAGRQQRRGSLRA